MASRARLWATAPAATSSSGKGGASNNAARFALDQGRVEIGLRERTGW